MNVIGAGLIDFAIATMALLLLMVCYGVGWSMNLLAAPVLVIAMPFTALRT